MRRLTTEEFIAKARAVHGDKYDYSKAAYINRNTKVCIICPEHGEFWQTPDNHLSKKEIHGCFECAKLRIGQAAAARARSKRPDLSHVITPPGSKAVPVGTKGDYALVDDEDYDRVMEHNWCIGSGYAVSNVVGRMHRFIMNPPDDMEVDHIFHNRLDNRKSQLRVCTPKENRTNIKPVVNSSSKYKGVGWSNIANKWRVSLGVNYKTMHIGYFDDEIEAARAYDEAAKKHHKDFARLNFPEK